MRLSETVRGLIATTPDERRVADMALRLACRDLRLDPQPRLNWFPFRPQRPRLLGYCSNDGMNIFIRAGLSAADLLETVLHELKHAQQERTKARKLSRSNLERDARLFSELEWPQLRRDISHRDLFKLLASTVIAIDPPMYPMSRRRVKVTVVEYCRICEKQLPAGEKWLCKACERA